MWPKDVMKLRFFRAGVYLVDPKYNDLHPREAEGALRQTWHGGGGGGDVKTEADCILVKCSLCVVVTVISYLWVGGLDLGE